MRELVNKSEGKSIIKCYKKDVQCCLIVLNGRQLKTISLYFEHLRKRLALSPSFSNNLNAYSDMMCDAHTYYNRERIVFVIRHYLDFLKEDDRKETIMKIFDRDIIPYFENHIEGHTQSATTRLIRVCCVIE